MNRSLLSPRRLVALAIVTLLGGAAVTGSAPAPASAAPWLSGEYVTPEKLPPIPASANPVSPHPDPASNPGICRNEIEPGSAGERNAGK